MSGRVEIRHKPDGVYVGELSFFDLFHGHGEYTFTAGDRYVGQWKDGARHGYGQFHFAAGGYYVGEWRDGKEHGFGEKVYSNGDCFRGEYQSGKRSGRGLYMAANGYSYTGHWADSTLVAIEAPAARPLLAPELRPALQHLAQVGKWVIGWIRHPECDVLLTESRNTPAQAQWIEVVSTTVQQRITGLAEITRGGRELIAAAAAADGELVLLVRCSSDGQSPVRHDYASRLFTRFPNVDTLNQGGRVVAYAYLPANSETGGAAQHLLVWNRAERAEHAIWRLTDVEATKQIAQLADPWQIAGCAGDAAGYVCVLWRPRGDAPPPERTAPQKHISQLLSTAAPAAVAAIEGLCATQPQADSLALRAVATALRQHAASPWKAYHGLAAAIAAPPVDLDVQALRACLQQLMLQDMQANRLSAVCAAMAQGPMDQGHVMQPLIEAMLGACAVDTEAAMAAPLAAAMAARSVEATTFLTRLGLRVPQAREQAESTGLPALAAAADGNLEGLRQWERMGPRARKTLLWVAQRAAQQSKAAGADLERRLANLVGLSAQGVADLRRFVQRADVWVNFAGHADNSLLASTSYQPQSAKRDTLERHRFAGHYHDGPLPWEEPPKYGWLNAHKVRLGLSAYGDSALVLRPHVQLRTNWVLRKDASTNVSVGTSVCMDHILLSLSDSVLLGLWAARHGERLDRLQNISDREGDFIEVQIHGPLDIQEDVRKVVAPTTALAGGAVSLSRFAQRAQLPLRWRDAGAIASDQRPRYVAALGQLGVSVAAWTSRANTDRLLLHPAAAQPSAPTHYELHTAPVQELLALINNVGRGQQDIVGLRLDPPNNQLNGRNPLATLLVREADAPVDYTVRRTAQLKERLVQMQANGLVVCAYAQEAQSNAPLPLHVLVAKQAAAGEAFTHQVVITDKAHLDAARATQVAAGWTVCGLASSDGNAFTLLLRRPVPPCEAPEDSGDTTLISGEPLSTVPESLRYCDDAGKLFDVDELVELIAHHGVFKNFYTNQALSAAEMQRLINHPSGAGARLLRMQSLQAEWRAAIGPDTGARILELATLLATEDTAGSLAGSTQAVAAFERFVLGLSAAEQAALHAGRFTLTDTHGQPFSLTVMEALSGLQRGAGCSRATASYLKDMMESIAPPVSRRRFKLFKRRSQGVRGGAAGPRM